MKVLLLGSAGLVAYAFVGYPALLALLTRLRPRPLSTQANFAPPVTLVVLAFDEEDAIEEKLRNVAQLDYPAGQLDVLVVADGSSDKTVERANAFAGVRVLHEPQRRGKMAAMHRGIDATSTSLLVFSDANNLYVPGALRAIVAPFADPAVGMATGCKLIDDGSGRAIDRAEGIYWRYESKVKQWESASGSVVGVCGEILAVRREAYRRPRAGTLNEDLVQALLVAAGGWRVAYAPAAVSVERASATIADEATRRSRLTVGRMQMVRELLPMLLRRHPRLAWQVISHKAVRPLVPWALASTALSNVALIRRPGWPRGLALAQLLFYGAAAAGRRDVRAGRQRSWTYVPYYFCRMNAATLAGARDFAAGREDNVWSKVCRAPAPERAVTVADGSDAPSGPQRGHPAPAAEAR